MSPTSEATKANDFIVRRDNFGECKFVASCDSGETTLEPGQALLRVTKFAFTANNITYAVAGDMLSYWNFFPTEEGWGRIPVWGIGVVEKSAQEGLAEGDRFFGYFPMSDYFTVQADKVTPQGFFDAAPHRQELPPTYNKYSRMTPEFGFDPKEDDYTMLFWPLFMTSFLIDDFLGDNDFFGAKSVVLSSASSKTSFGLAHALSQREDPRCEVIGLTSPGNLEFVKGLGCYDKVVVYDAIDSLPSDTPTVFVDMAGDAGVLSAIHHHFGDQLKYSCQVGITHWAQAGPASGLPGATPTMFFAPDQIQKRSKEWGPSGIQQRFATAWAPFMKSVANWISVVHSEGEAGVQQVYLETLAGKARPDEGHVVSL